MTQTTANTKRQDATVASALSVLADRIVAEGVDLADFDDLADFLRLHLAGREREIFWCVALDSRGCLLAAEPLFLGTTDEVKIHYREILKFLLAHNAIRAVIAHNHPMGQAQPSVLDFDHTEALRDTLDIVGIELMEHLLVVGLNVLRVSEFERRASGNLEAAVPSQAEWLHIVGGDLAGARRLLSAIDPRETEPYSLLVAAARRESTR